MVLTFGCWSICFQHIIMHWSLHLVMLSHDIGSHMTAYCLIERNFTTSSSCVFPLRGLLWLLTINRVSTYVGTSIGSGDRGQESLHE